MKENRNITLGTLCELFASPYSEITIVDEEQTLEYPANKIPFSLLWREIDFIDSGNNGADTEPMQAPKAPRKAAQAPRKRYNEVAEVPEKEAPADSERKEAENPGEVPDGKQNASMTEDQIAGKPFRQNEREIL